MWGQYRRCGVKPKFVLTITYTSSTTIELRMGLPRDPRYVRVLFSHLISARATAGFIAARCWWKFYIHDTNTHGVAHGVTGEVATPPAASSRAWESEAILLSFVRLRHSDAYPGQKNRKKTCVEQRLATDTFSIASL